MKILGRNNIFFQITPQKSKTTTNCLLPVSASWAPYCRTSNQQNNLNLILIQINIQTIIYLIMFWWPCQEKPLAFWKIMPLQLPSTVPTQFKDSQQRSYGRLAQQCERLERENQQLKNQIISLKRKVRSGRVRKIKRRAENELIKNFQCAYPNCKKQYASSLALNLHMKNKHNAGSKKDRLIAANQIIKAQAQGREEPQLDINLPPNYLESLKSQKQLTLSCCSSPIDKQKNQEQNIEE